MNAIVMILLQGLLAIAIAAAALRLLRGPTLANRVAALELLTVMGVGVAAVHVLRTGQAMLLDVALAVGLVAFVGITAFALLIDRDGNDEALVPVPPEASGSRRSTVAQPAEEPTP